uniref:Uncharacterized protein n=1 Tax=uncultured bacterium Ad_125_D08 TaxID=1489285 RepID=A0A0B4N0R1_9BACT|nr:putative hypothetical protein [uncultured bacterium Ad_125_D08]
MNISNNLLRGLFENVYFIIGTAYAGKSTMVRMLAGKHDGVFCGENYHDVLMSLIDPEHQPNLGYFQMMSGWQEFISRTPQAYADWIDGTAREAAELEIIELIRRTAGGRRVFVDTNISADALREISDYRRVAVMLSDPSVSVSRFFDRPDAEKQFIYQQLLQAPDPEAAMANYRAILERINRPERYRELENSGFFTLKRDDRRTPEETMAILEAHFGL